MSFVEDHSLYNFGLDDMHSMLSNLPQIHGDMGHDEGDGGSVAVGARATNTETNCIDPSLLALDNPMPPVSPLSHEMSSLNIASQGSDPNLTPELYSAVQSGTQTSYRKRMTAFRRVSSLSPSLGSPPPHLPQASDISFHYQSIKESLSQRVVPASEHSRLFKPLIDSDSGGRRCLLCGYTRVNHTQIIQHLREHFQIYPFACDSPGCSFTSTRRADAKKHMKEQHGNLIWFFCPSCAKSFRHERNYRRHVRTQHL